MSLIDVIGADGAPEKLTTLQVCARGVLVFAFAVLMMRLSSRRFLSEASPLDVILGVMVGSMLSRTINGPSPLFATMGGVAALVLLHRVLLRTAFHSRRISNLLKGRPVVLAEAGRPIAAALKQAHISHQDLLQALRTRGGVAALGRETSVVLERSGRVSVVQSPVGDLEAEAPAGADGNPGRD